MKNNYPIYYAVKTIVEETIIPVSCGQIKDKTEYYIASKCYLLGHDTRYTKEGQVKETYLVVFPYKYNQESNIWERIDPTPADIEKIEKIFNTYEQANNEAEIQNNLSRIRKKIDFDSKNGFSEEKLRKYKQLSSKIEEKTDELIVGNKPKEQRIFLEKDGEIRFVQGTLYEFINFFYQERFQVYTVSNEKFEALKECNILNNSTPYSNNDRLLIYSLAPKDINIYLQDSQAAIRNKRIYALEKPKVDNLTDGIKVYTLEDYEDIINSFPIADDNATKKIYQKQFSRQTIKL